LCASFTKKLPYSFADLYKPREMNFFTKSAAISSGGPIKDGNRQKLMEPEII
jgi:hypothetical protein